jgi:hypothetical protein
VFTGHLVGERGDHVMAALTDQALARLSWGAVAVAFEQPVLVVVAGELTDVGAQRLERVEALDPQDLFLERLG